MVRQYVVLTPSEATRRSYGTLPDLQARIVELLSQLHAPQALSNAVNVASAPTGRWRADLVGYPPDLSSAPRGEPPENELVVSLEFTEPEVLLGFREFIVGNLNRPTDSGDAFTWIGADPGGNLADHWCPGTGTLGAFAKRDDAHRQLSVSSLDALPPTPAAAPKVNVVIIDQGLNKAAIKPENWGGGWERVDEVSGKKIYSPPGSAERTSHGMMIARNILSVAPEAVLYDFPLIPRPIIRDVSAFASDAHVAFHLLVAWIAFLRMLHPRWSGPWVLVNAWAIYDRSTEIPLGDYTENLNTSAIPNGHRLNRVIKQAAQQAGIDFIFAAGNCGTFCPSPRCGKVDRGPGSSIWGANSLAEVTTVSAVLTNDMWLGYASQGPGQRLLGEKKPDFCAPSQFWETTDANVRNTGTSAACGLTAGVVAALRRVWSAPRVSPLTLKQVLVDTARKTQGEEPNGRLGYGVLNAQKAVKRLLRDYPLAPGQVAQAVSSSKAPSSVVPTPSPAPTPVVAPSITPAPVEQAPPVPAVANEPSQTWFARAVARLMRAFRQG